MLVLVTVPAVGITVMLGSLALLHAPKDRSDWWMVPMLMKGVLKYAMVDAGVLFVMTSGTLMMLVLHVNKQENLGEVR